MLNIEEKDGVTVVTLADGKANTLGSGMVGALTDAAEKLQNGRGGIVVTGGGRFFSAGLALDEVAALSRETLGAFLDGFEKMAVSWFKVTRPVVAAVNGHAIAGGAILALTADHRIAGRGEWKFGLTEVSLGIPFPASALELVRFQVDGSRASRLFLAGELYGPDEAVAAGLIDKAVAPEALVQEAVALAGRLGKTPGSAFSRTKIALREPTLERYEAVRAQRKEAFIEALFDPAVKAHIGATLEAMKAKKK
jgi:enoyl-CoA hydratase